MSSRPGRRKLKIPPRAKVPRIRAKARELQCGALEAMSILETERKKRIKAELCKHLDDVANGADVCEILSVLVKELLV